MKKPLHYSIFVLLISVMVFSCEETTVDPADTYTTDGLAYVSAGGTVAPGSGPGGGSQQPAGVITAGEWNDLQHWDFLMKLLSRDTFGTNMATWGFSPLKRYSYIIKDEDGKPLTDATIKLKADNGTVVWQGRSDNFGVAELFPNLFNNSIIATSTVVNYNNQSFAFQGVKQFENGVNSIYLPLSENSISAVDVMFVVDATGSMGDELEYLKTELSDVLNRAASTPGISLRTASVFYRDDGDEYVTRISDFTAIHNTTVQFVKNQSAAGGGDWPEAVHTALEHAVTQATWSEQAKARLLFLVLDAPPHENDAVKAKVRAMTQLAASKGIKIIPVTASGIDKSTEFLMRFLATTTNGTYVFITNHSGIGEEHIQATVGDYEVEFLNNLMVRLIKKYSE